MCAVRNQDPMNNSLKRGPARHAFRKSSQTELSILRLIHAQTQTSRVELAELSGLSTAAITGIVNSLVTRNLLVEQRQRAAMGRKRILLAMRPDLGYVAGVDLGTVNLRICITDFNGTVVAGREVPSEMFRGRTEVLARAFALLRELLTQAGVGEGLLKGIGIGFSGVIDVARGMILSYPRPGQIEQWKNTPLRSMAEQEFGIPVLLEDSVRTIATMERLHGKGRNYQNFVYVDVGVGVGAAIFIDGRLYRGHGGSAGEFGHMTVDEDGPLCCCGSSGCLEAVASGAAIIEGVKTALRRGVPSRMTERDDFSIDTITLEMIAEAAALDDSLACRALSEAAAHIGAAAADLVNLLNPASIIFGGALFRAAPEMLISSIRSAIRHRAMAKSVSDVVIQSSPLTEVAGAHGAARLIATQLVECMYLDSNTDAATASTGQSLYSL